MLSSRRADVAGLTGWTGDDHAAALAAYRLTEDLLPPDWPRHAGEEPRLFFETNFRLADPREALLTGYYEPEVPGSDAPDDAFRHPLYAPPPDLSADHRWFTRAEIEAGGLLAGRELVWLSSAIEAYLAQVQGSLRVRLPDGRVLRLGFAGRNGHPYRSIGAELIQRGAIPAEAMSAQAIREWCARHPGAITDLLHTNPSFVFFKSLDLPADSGPLGALGRPVTAQRSLAVDPVHVALGVPVWVCAEGTCYLTVAQDTGSAITGSARADLFCGSGDAAGEIAGRMRESAVLTPLLPLPKKGRSE